MTAQQIRDIVREALERSDFASVTDVDAGESVCLGIETPSGELFILTVEEA